MASFQNHFRYPDLNRLSTATTGIAGYYAGYYGTANQIAEKLATPTPINHAANNAATNAQMWCEVPLSPLSVGAGNLFLPQEWMKEDCPELFNGITLHRFHAFFSRRLIQ
jgi:hypothetical protein